MARPAVPLLLAAALIFGGNNAMAQAKGTPKKKDTKVLLYKDRLAAEWDTVNCVKNVFKINPLLFLRGEMPLYYERALSHRLSAEIALGVTFRNYMGGGFTGDVADEFSAGTKILARPSYHVGFRWYLTDDLEPQGVYVQGEFAYSDYRKDITKKDSTGHFTDETLRNQRLYNDIRFYFGYQRLAGTNNWLIDAYCGLGYRNRSLLQVEERIDLVDRRWSYSVEETHDNVLAVFLGLKIGYGF